MIESTDRQREAVGWSVSIVVHVGLLILGAAWLIQPARIQVTPGKTSTEIDFAVEAPVPVPVTSPPTPAPPPAPVPAPQPKQAVPIAKPVQPKAPAPPQPVVIPPPKTSVAPAKPPHPKPPLATQQSSVSNRTIAAQPDELHNEPPEYPNASRAAREEGDVLLKVEVTAAGEPASVTIERSSGYSRLDHAAQHAVQHWKFHPASIAGMPLSSEIFVPVHFKLQDAD
jgi:protein TonB